MWGRITVWTSGTSRIYVLLENIVVMMKLWQRRWAEQWFVWRKIRLGREQKDEEWFRLNNNNNKNSQGLQEFVDTPTASTSRGFYLRLCHNSTSGDSAFQGLLLSLAALISAMNSQLFVFVQQHPGLLMTVYHEGNLSKSSPCYWVSQINDIHWQTWVKQ